VNLQLQPRLTGAGRPLLLQGPAWGPSSDYLRLTLAPMFESCRVATYDPRNVGDAPRVDLADAQAVEHLVADLESVRRQLGFERFVLAGHSHGGFIAMAYAVRYPQHLDGMLLLNTAVRREPPGEDVECLLQILAEDPARRDAIALFRSTSGRPPEAVSDAELARHMRRLMPAYFFDLEAMRRFAVAARAARPPSAAALARVPDEFEAWVEEGLADVNVPALVITGAYDVATTVADAQRIHGLLPRSVLEIFPHSGHHPWVEEPERFASLVRGFLVDLDASMRR